MHTGTRPKNTSTRASPRPRGQRRGVEEAEHHAQRAHRHEPPAAVHYERQPHGAGRSSCNDEGAQHLPWLYPPLCAGTTGAKATVIVVATNKIEIIVYEVGVNLHHKSERNAQHGGHCLESCGANIGEGQRKTYHHWYGSRRKRLGPRSQEPCFRRARSNLFFHRFLSYKVLRLLSYCISKYSKVFAKVNI